jgi:hypothetical protein
VPRFKHLLGCLRFTVNPGEVITWGKHLDDGLNINW